MAQGEILNLTFIVELVAGSPGDVNLDRIIDELDIAALTDLLNTFINDLNHPGDIDGDGQIGQSDLELLNELIDISNRNLPPTADAGGPYEADAGQLVTLDGSGSIDPDGSITLYEWDLDDDSQYDDATGITAQITFNEPGQFGVRLKVTDDSGLSDTDSAQVTVLPSRVGGTTSFSVSESGPPVGGIVSLAGGILSALVICMVGGWYAKKRRLKRRS